MLNTSFISIDIKKQLGAHRLDYKLTVPNEGTTFLYGPSGGGKTSLINLLAGLLEPDSGHIKIGEEIIFDSTLKINKKAHQRSIGYVFQDARLFPHMNVEQNLFYSKNAKSNLKNNAKGLQLIKLLGLSPLMKQKPHTLSGGERQRVAIARALLSEPKMLLLDEPFSSLDQRKKEELVAYFDKLVKHLRIPIIMISHSKDEVFKLAKNLVLINDGHVVKQGSLEHVWNTKDWKHLENNFQTFDLLYTASFVEQDLHYLRSKVRLLEPVSKELTNCCLWIDEPESSFNENKLCRIQLHPQDISISLDSNAVSSISNRIACDIEEHIQFTSNQTVIATLKFHENILFFAKINLQVWDEMGLENGQKVIAQVNNIRTITT